MFKKIIMITVILIIISLLSRYLFTEAGNFLTVSDAPKKSDVIVVLAGNEGRAEYGISLLKEGYGDHIIFSGTAVKGDTVTEAEYMMREALELGVPQEKIILEKEADSTLANGTYCRELIMKYGFKSAIIVTSNYHLRRTRLVFGSLMKNSGVYLTYCGAAGQPYNGDKWWEDPYSLSLTGHEYTGILWYGLRYGLWFR